ncbi:MAG: DUF3824 domain-containing protein [Elusimicrobia bacterium]|nr:DUF3824 domain-containing protein [Elusimicrobiota bacterium]
MERANDPRARGRGRGLASMALALFWLGLAAHVWLQRSLLKGLSGFLR